MTVENERHLLNPTFAEKKTLSVLVIFLAVMFFTSPDIVSDSMRTGLTLCAQTIIPSLFPFMILSELIVQGGLGVEACRLFGKPLGRMFGISVHAVCPLLLGFFCGFPIGASSAVTLYRSGVLSRDEFERVMLFCNQSSPAFLLTAVGLSLWSNINKGFVILPPCINWNLTKNPLKPYLSST